MADDLEPNPIEPYDTPEPEGDGGGPVKTFLEHLEDLRWTLIKCAIVIFLGFAACLSGSNYVIRFLTWPLEKAEGIRTTTDARVVFLLGTNVVARMSPADSGVPGVATNGDTILRLEPELIGTNLFLALRPVTNPPAGVTREFTVQLKTLGPVTAFSIVMQIAMFGGITVAIPFVLFFLAQFILPALHNHEKAFVFKVAGWATFLFLVGVAFCYFVILIICLSTTVSFSNWLGFAADEWKADEYISFVCWFMLGMGAAFQLPLILLTLVKIGILDHVKLAKMRAYVAVGVMVLAAFITPDGNPVNMMLLAIPLHFLYEISTLIAWWWSRSKPKTLDVDVNPGPDDVE
jgi:sec-independent protein translocase protein TatC